MDFAKIVVVDGLQVLFYTEPDPNVDGRTKLHQIAKIDGIQADVAAGGINEDADKIIARIGEKDAREVLRLLRQFIC